MKILVTGGAGYIGSVVAEQLIGAGESVVVFDNLSQGHSAAVHSSAVFIKGDLSDRAAIDGALSEHRPDAVMHFASRTLVGESMENPYKYFHNNVYGGLNLLRAAVETNVDRAQFTDTLRKLIAAPPKPKAEIQRKRAARTADPARPKRKA